MSLWSAALQRRYGQAASAAVTPPRWRSGALALALLILAGCHTDMWRQPKHDPLDPSDFYVDGAANRPLLPGTIARGHLREDDEYFTGQVGGKWIDGLPSSMHLNRQQLHDLLLRGQERFNIYCTPCHSRLGDGKGMIALRGYETRRPVGDYHTDRLRRMPMGHFYDVITNGYGAMYSYASRIEPQDRWAVAAYIRALQLSQHAPPDDPAVHRLVAQRPSNPVFQHSSAVAMQQWSNGAVR